MSRARSPLRPDGVTQPSGRHGQARQRRTNGAADDHGRRAALTPGERAMARLVGEIVADELWAHAMDSLAGPGGAGAPVAPRPRAAFRPSPKERDDV